MQSIVDAIDARLKMLETVRNILAEPKPRSKRKISKVGRERIAKAQRLRWKLIHAKRPKVSKKGTK